MTDTMKQKPLKVRDSTDGPYLLLPLTQVEAAIELIDNARPVNAKES